MSKKTISLDSTTKRFKNSIDRIPEDLINSAEKIISYSGISKEDAELFRASLYSFIQLKNKSAIDKDTMKIRDSLLLVFFKLYGMVFTKVRQEGNDNPLYHMFLNYGYIDERLLKPEQVNELYALTEQPAGRGEYLVYNMESWLEKIYDGEKDPSVNIFGQDYFDLFREKKKRGEVSKNDKPAYDNNMEGRLNHEIDGLLKSGQRHCYGRMTGYFPILHSEMITGSSLAKSRVTPERIEDAVNKVLDVDFSAFYREIAYNNSAANVKNQLIMKSVLPDFILMPTFGSRAVMWQEFTGRVRSSPGRFVFPIFTNEDLFGIMLEVIAEFRWQLSKSMSSYIRIDSRENTLVSDYSDYIQFYKKNHELSNGVREKLKTQIKKNRNNVRDVFVSDYNTWINYESKGLIRLNKVARGILFKYCPFSKPIRERLAKQPLLNPMVTQFDNMRAQQIKTMEALYARITKPGASTDQELMDNLQFYKM